MAPWDGLCATTLAQSWRWTRRSISCNTIGLSILSSVIHIQQFINKCNVKYQPYGSWRRFSKGIFGTKPCTVDTVDSSTTHSDSEMVLHRCNRVAASNMSLRRCGTRQWQGNMSRHRHSSCKAACSPLGAIRSVRKATSHRIGLALNCSRRHVVA